MNRGGAHFLLVGDSGDFGALREAVGRLPVDAYGQIFVEVASAVQIQQWRVPAGMTLTWLCRDRASNAGRAVEARGELASRAVSAWVAEWIPERHTDHEMPYVLWIGCSASKAVDRLYRELAVRIRNLHLHLPRAD